MYSGANTTGESSAWDSDVNTTCFTPARPAAATAARCWVRRLPGWSTALVLTSSNRFAPANASCSEPGERSDAGAQSRTARHCPAPRGCEPIRRLPEAVFVEDAVSPLGPRAATETGTST